LEVGKHGKELTLHLSTRNRPKHGKERHMANTDRIKAHISVTGINVFRYGRQRRIPRGYTTVLALAAVILSWGLAVEGFAAWKEVAMSACVDDCVLNGRYSEDFCMAYCTCVVIEERNPVACVIENWPWVSHPRTQLDPTPPAPTPSPRTPIGDVARMCPFQTTLQAPMNDSASVITIDGTQTTLLSLPMCCGAVDADNMTGLNCAFLEPGRQCAGDILACSPEHVKTIDAEGKGTCAAVEE
jgi:hypothetical protein